MTDPATLHRELLERLAEITRQWEAHETAQWLLEQERARIREQLIASGWKPPEVSR